MCFFLLFYPIPRVTFVHFYSLEWRKKFSTYSRIFCILLEFKVSCRILGVGSSSGSFFVPDARNSVVLFLRWFPGAPAVHYELNSVGFDALRITFRDTTSIFLQTQLQLCETSLRFIKKHFLKNTKSRF